jgi:hypothetical protein
VTEKEMIREIRSLASGTLANLFGTPRYDEIDARLLHWIEWIESFAQVENFTTWQDAWAAYKVAGERHACGNALCAKSTGIHDGITCGSGELEEFGYWEKPCRICAEAFDRDAPKRIEETIAQLKADGRPYDESTLRNDYSYLFIPAWPWKRS